MYFRTNIFFSYVYIHTLVYTFGILRSHRLLYSLLFISIIYISLIVIYYLERLIYIR